MKIFKFWPLFSVLIVLAGLTFFLKSDFWSIKKINCRLEQAPCAANWWTDLMAKTAGKNLFFLKSAKIKQEILHENPLLQGVIINKSWPDQLNFKLQERKPEVRLSNAEKQNQLILDKEGIILLQISSADYQNLPLIVNENLPNQKVGERINQKEIVTTIAILTNLRFNLFEPLVAQVSGNKITVSFRGNLEIIFSTEKPINDQIDSLQLIFSRAKIEGRTLRRIDLRFDKPVANYD